jgi:hypothetical protein
MPETVSVAGFASKTTSRKDLARLIAWALIMVVGATLVMPESVCTGRKEDRAEVILSDLPPPGDGLKKTGGQELVLEALKSSNETLVVGVMASLKGAAAEYALTRDAQGKVSATRPWCEGDHSFYRE